MAEVDKPENRPHIECEPTFNYCVTQPLCIDTDGTCPKALAGDAWFR